MKKYVTEIVFQDSKLVYMLVSEHPEELRRFFESFPDTECLNVGKCMKWIRDHDVYVNIYLDGRGSFGADLEKGIRTRELKRMGKYYSLEEMREDFRKNRLKAYDPDSKM